MNRSIVPCFVPLVVMLGLLAPAAGFADEDDGELSLEERREQARVERLWNLTWRDFAPHYLAYEGAFVCVPGYERGLPSSAGVSVSDYRDDTTWQQAYTDERGRDTTRKLVKPEEEAFAAVALLPKVEPGQYGYIHSGNIESIRDDKTVELEDVWLVDAEAVREEKKGLKEKLWGQVLEDIEDAIRNRDQHKRGRRDRRQAENEAIDWGFEARESAIQRQRDREFSRMTWVVEGFATERLREGARWPSENAKAPGLQLVVVKVEDRIVTALPAASLGKGITELEFIDLLQSKDLNKAKFVELVNQARREDRRGYVGLVLDQLEGNPPPPAEGVNDEVQLAE
ncbi:MAG: hypothetical protein ACPGYV_07630 [Phycisphaeraceae bacterium]